MTGNAVISSKGSHSHGGVILKVEGTVQLQLSPNSVGLLESLSSTMKPVGLISLTKEVLAAGKFSDGKTSVPFEFKLNPSGPRPLLETYHGVYICVQYMLTIEVMLACVVPEPILPITPAKAQVQRGSLFSQGMQECTEFIVEVPVSLQESHLLSSHGMQHDSARFAARQAAVGDTSAGQEFLHPRVGER